MRRQPAPPGGGRKSRAPREAPRPKPLRRPGATPDGTDHPPLVDLQVLPFTPTSHRPSSPKGWRAMPRYRPGLGLPRSVPVTSTGTRAGQVRPDDESREEAHDEQRFTVGRIPIRPKTPRLDSRPTGEPANSPPSRVTVEGTPRQAGRLQCRRLSGKSSLHRFRWRLVDRTPCSIIGPRASDRLSVGPGLRCALRYVGHLVGHIAPGQGQLSNSQGCPRNFPVTHRFGAFIHRSCTAIPTVAGRSGASTRRGARRVWPDLEVIRVDSAADPPD